MHAADALKLINYCYCVEVTLEHYVDKLLMGTSLKRKIWNSQLQGLRKFHLWL